MYIPQFIYFYEKYRNTSLTLTLHEIKEQNGYWSISSGEQSRATKPKIRKENYRPDFIVSVHER